MQGLNNYFKSGKLYFLALITVLFLSSIFLLYNGKTVTFLSLKSYHSFWLNVFFINYTFIGDGVFAFCLIAFLFFYVKKKKLSTTLLYSVLIAALLVQVIKNLQSITNPKIFIEAGQYLFGANTINDTVFPSGHTAIAFAMATVLVFFLKTKRMQLLILIGALLVAYSRVYLAQHFLIDIIAGVLIGSVSGIAAVYVKQNSKRIKMDVKKIHKISTKANHELSENIVQPA